MRRSRGKTWTNWSGSVRCTPQETIYPKTESDLANVVAESHDAGRKIRVAGAGHSSSPLLTTNDQLISLNDFTGVVDHNRDRLTATVRAGMTLGDAGEALFDHGLAFHNLGDIDKQTVTGAITVGTHGTGRTLKNLGSILIGGRLVLADGSILEVHEHDDPELIQALRVSLGLLGIFAELRIKLMPAVRLRRREWCAHVDACMRHLDDLVRDHRSMDFYWYPRRDEVKIRTMNPEQQPIEDIPYARLVEDKTDWSHRIIAQDRDLRFEEMEYMLPADAGPSCFLEVRERIRKHHRATVAWRVLYRTVAADDAWLSPAYGRDTVTISIHQNASLPYKEFFADIEPIFRAYGGRPHWGKKHSLAGSQLRELYPAWDCFQSVRRELDPRGTFLTPEMASLMDAEGNDL